MNQILIPVLHKDETWKQHKEKLEEEFKELTEQLDNLEKCEDQIFVLEQVVEEALDVIQVSIGILSKASKKMPGLIQRKCGDHIRKLLTKGWIFEKVLRVDED